mmetsp:Transcript_58287/g.119213  ORF Transcript_58287/g.119213 Transcript_58287/m.119213 type:complete len:116 (+) Transcript_58287:307-654(+)
MIMITLTTSSPWPPSITTLTITTSLRSQLDRHNLDLDHNLITERLHRHDHDHDLHHTFTTIMCARSPSRSQITITNTITITDHDHKHEHELEHDHDDAESRWTAARSTASVHGPS